MGAPTKYRFPQGTTRSFLLRFKRADGNPEGRIVSFGFFIKRNGFDADAAALVDMSGRISVYDQDAGLAVLIFTPADTAALDAFLSKEVQVRAYLLDGSTLAHEEHCGPLVFTPLVGDPDIAEPPNDFIEPITDMNAFVRLLTDIIGLTGNTTGKLDALSSVVLSAMPTGQQVECFFAGGISVRYRLEDRDGRTESPAASGGFRIFCDNDAVRLWNLVAVTKEGVPCVWNPDTVKWHQVLSAGAAGNVQSAIDQNGFSLPT